jgi:hypothetical protein
MSKDIKLDKKSLKMPDKMTQAGLGLLQSLWKNRKTVSICVGILFVVALGYYGFSLWTNYQLEKSWQAFYEIQKLPLDKKLEAYKGFQEKYSSHRPAQVARIELANYDFNLAKKSPKKIDEKLTQSAIEWFSKALTYPKLSPVEKQLLLISKGKSFELLSNYNEAQSQFTQAATVNAEATGLAYLSIARIYELKKENNKAIETYQKIALDFNNTEYAKQAKNYLRILQKKGHS